MENSHNQVDYIIFLTYLYPYLLWLNFILLCFEVQVLYNIIIVKQKNIQNIHTCTLPFCGFNFIL